MHYRAYANIKKSVCFDETLVFMDKYPDLDSAIENLSKAVWDEENHMDLLRSVIVIKQFLCNGEPDFELCPDGRFPEDYDAGVKAVGIFSMRPCVQEVMEMDQDHRGRIFGPIGGRMMTIRLHWFTAASPLGDIAHGVINSDGQEIDYCGRV